MKRAWFDTILKQYVQQLFPLTKVWRYKVNLAKLPFHPTLAKIKRHLKQVEQTQWYTHLNKILCLNLNLAKDFKRN